MKQHQTQIAGIVWYCLLELTYVLQWNPPFSGFLHVTTNTVSYQWVTPNFSPKRKGILNKKYLFCCTKNSIVHVGNTDKYVASVQSWLMILTFIRDVTKLNVLTFNNIALVSPSQNKFKVTHLTYMKLSSLSHQLQQVL